MSGIPRDIVLVVAAALTFMSATSEAQPSCMEADVFELAFDRRGQWQNTGALELEDTWRNPASMLGSLLTDNRYYLRCAKDIFSSPALTASLDEIYASIPQPVIAEIETRYGTTDPRRVALLYGFRIIGKRWRWGAKAPDGIYGCVELNSIRRDELQSATVRLYRTHRSPEKLYNLDIVGLSNGVKWFMIAAHEYGHVLDALAGGLEDGLWLSRRDEKLKVETRATAFATFFLRCFSRQLSRYYLRLQSESEGEDALNTLQCLERKWRAVDEQLGEQQAVWQAGLQFDFRALSEAIAGRPAGLACAASLSAAETIGSATTCPKGWLPGSERQLEVVGGESESN